MKTLNIFLAFILIPLLTYAQTTSYHEKAKSHYDKGEYREALYCFNHALKTDSTNAEFFKFRGNCYFELNQLDSAERDYLKVIRLSDKFPEAYYNLANVSNERKNTVKAESFIRKFLSFKPDDAEGLYHLYALLKNRKNDSAFFVLKKAYTLDSANQYFYNALAWEYFDQKNYSRSLAMAEHSRIKYAITNDLLSLEAYASFCSGNFDRASKVTDTLVAKFEDNINYKILQTKAKILKNTPKDKFTQDGFTFTFTDASDLSQIDSWIRDPAHPYYYPKLMTKFKSKVEEMTFPEFFMVYYGYTTDDKYSPYGMGSSAIVQAARKEQSAPDALGMYKSALETDPFHLQAYEAVASLAMNLGHKADFERSLTQYIGLMEGILATGDGKSSKSAYIVISPRHEYHLLDYLGLTSSMQALRHEGGHSFDVLTVTDENIEKKEIYFNIDKPWNSLSESFNTRKSTAKKKDKKRKKRD